MNSPGTKLNAVQHVFNSFASCRCFKKKITLGTKKRLIIDLYLMMIDVILLFYIHFSALINSIHFSAKKS